MLPGQANPLRHRLLPGERLLWEGQPDPRAFTFAGAPVMIPFTVLWTAFSIFWEWSAIDSGAPLFFALWGVPFVLVGVYLVAGRFAVAWREATRTWYTVTDRRVMLLGGAWRPRYVELDLLSLPAPQLDEGGGGIGTITFGPAYPAARWLGPSWPGVRSAPAIIAVRDAGRVFRAIAEARASALAQVGAR